jgi:hypothetical protein
MGRAKPHAGGGTRAQVTIIKDKSKIILTMTLPTKETQWRNKMKFSRYKLMSNVAVLSRETK